VDQPLGRDRRPSSSPPMTLFTQPRRDEKAQASARRPAFALVDSGL
jgi:hypothetical protein